MSISNRITPKQNSKRHYYIKASATVEASIITPIFVYAVVAVVYMLQILRIRNDVSIASYNTARALSKYSYAYEKTGSENQTLSKIAAYTILLSELGADYAENANIVGGSAGISLLGSEILENDNEIKLVVSYTVKNPLDIFGCNKTKITQTFLVGAWLGDEACKEENGKLEECQLVYITEYGEVYHTSEKCSYIDISIRQITADRMKSTRNLSGGKYYACNECCKEINIDTNAILYITDYGDRYHISSECSCLKRTVIKVPIKSVSGMHKCVKCSGR